MNCNVLSTAPQAQRQIVAILYIMFATLGLVVMIQHPAVMIPVPRQLIIAHHEYPLRVGIYVLFGRLYLHYERSIPLSYQDIALFDPTIKVGSYIRALAALEVDHWLLRKNSVSKRRNTYLPSWGINEMKSNWWSMKRKQLHIPHGIDYMLASSLLFDRYMGSIFVLRAKNLVYPSQLEIHLRIRDIGSYIIHMSGIPSVNPLSETFELLNKDGHIIVPS